ncbi:MAG: cysteine desulfurase NifS [Candidatus Syntrophoarchaeum caldarius]|uniref:Cysteine desulfurase IscS n=1 Tax=Candidatus Syntropharchaeum caldarium TaxID=1838285 RepID=A0A1F2P7Z1_9EURY|nr:MAG: cysteine desulfurase NifS [Candidatus Syntrophoarchaeum caldarius]
MVKLRRIYLDNAATSCVDPDVVEAMLPYFTKKYGNASSLHQFGREAKSAMEDARSKVADLIGADPREVIFTAGGTESDNLAIKGIAYRKGSGHIITSAIEHPAVLETCRALEKQGFDLTYIGVDRYGRVNPQDVEDAIRNDTILITIMHANNEIGTIQPIEKISEIAGDKGIPFHTDAVQSVGKIPIDLETMKADILSISSHKIHGPKGVGALFIRKGTLIAPIIHGGGHEKGLRSSTENIPGIVGFGKACQIALERMSRDIPYMSGLRDRLIKGVLEGIEAAYLNGHPVDRLCNNAHFRFTAIEGESLLMSLDLEGIAASTGSACSSKKLAASHVLMAIGLDEVAAHGSLRLTLSRFNTREEVDYFLEVLPRAVERLREISPLWGK